MQAEQRLPIGTSGRLVKRRPETLFSHLRIDHLRFAYLSRTMKPLILERRFRLGRNRMAVAWLAVGIATAVSGCGGGGGGNGPAAGTPSVGAGPGTGAGDPSAPTGAWQQTVRLRPANPGRDEAFGSAVRQSADGSTLAVSEVSDKSASTTINGSETDRPVGAVIGSGSVHVYTRGVDGHFVRQAYLKAPQAGGWFGSGLAVSPDGNRIVAGAPAARGVRVDYPYALGGTEYGFGAGSLYQLDRDAAGQWQLSQSLTIPDGRQSDNLGWAVAMSDDAQWVVAGAPSRRFGDVNTAEDYRAGLEKSGAAYVFRRDASGQLVQQQRLRAPAPAAYAAFGSVVAISGDGAWIAVGAPNDSNGLDGQPVADPLAAHVRNSGAVHVYQRQADGTFKPFAALKAPVGKNFQQFGGAIAMSGDGSRMAIGGAMSGYAVESEPIYSIAATADIGPGEVFLYQRGASGWTLEATLAGIQGAVYDRFFGYAVDLSPDGQTLAVGMPLDGSGVGAPNAAGYLSTAGSVRLYQLGAAGWTASQTLRPATAGQGSTFGRSVSLSRDGHTLAAGANREKTPGAGIDPPTTGQEVSSGAAYVFRR